MQQLVSPSDEGLILEHNDRVRDHMLFNCFFSRLGCHLVVVVLFESALFLVYLSTAITYRTC